VWRRLALFKRARLIRFGQANIAMSAAMDVHEHGSADKKRVLVNSGVFALRYIG